MSDAEHVCHGAAVFCRAFGACLIYFAYATLPGYIDFLDSTIIVFPYAPWQHLPMPPMTREALEKIRLALMVCGGGLATGVLPRACLGAAFAIVAYTTQLDRTFYNNHYVLLQLLCLLLIGAIVGGGVGYLYMGRCLTDSLLPESWCMGAGGGSGDGSGNDGWLVDYEGS